MAWFVKPPLLVRAFSMEGPGIEEISRIVHDMWVGFDEIKHDAESKTVTFSTVSYVDEPEQIREVARGFGWVDHEIPAAPVALVFRDVEAFRIEDGGEIGGGCINLIFASPDGLIVDCTFDVFVHIKTPAPNIELNVLDQPRSTVTVRTYTIMGRMWAEGAIRRP